jgi:hypothetical protein
MPISSFDLATGNLPPGIYEATWEEVARVFGSNSERRRLLEGLLRALQALRAAGCGRAYVDGSFVTRKDIPGDYDACWEPDGVDSSRLDPVLLDFGPGRAAQKAKYYGELFVSSTTASAGSTFLDFFQRDKATGDPKGIVAIDLGGLP